MSALDDAAMVKVGVCGKISIVWLISFLLSLHLKLEGQQSGNNSIHYSVYIFYMPKTKTSILWVVLVLLGEAAQLALEAAERRRKVASRIHGAVDDKRERQPATSASTKVTPEGKKPCHAHPEVPAELEPRALSFSEADGSGEIFLYLALTNDFAMVKKIRI